MKKIVLLLAALTASAVLMTACSRNRNDADTNSVTHTEASETDRMDITEETVEETRVSDDSGIMDDAEDLVSDVVDEGGDIVSDVIDGGRDIVTDLIGTDEISTSESTR